MQNASARHLCLLEKRDYTNRVQECRVGKVELSSNFLEAHDLWA